MYSIINPPFMGSRTPPVMPLYEYIVKGLNTELTRIKDYYRQNLWVVNNTHILRKILVDIENKIALSPEALVRSVRSDTLRYCRAYGINSPIFNAGIQNDGNFYNKKNPEVFLNAEYDFDVENCYKEYKNLKPVRVVSHEFSDLNLYLPSGKYISDECGLCVFTIDLALLALQYKAWTDKERYPEGKDYALPMHNFIHSYVLTNMLDSHVDVAIFNRFRYLAQEKPIPKPTQSLPFYIADYSEKVDWCHRKLLEVFDKQPNDYLQRLNALPSVTYGTYYRSVAIPDMAPTRNIKWALLLAKINSVELMLDIDDKTDSQSIAMVQREALARDLRVTISDKSLLMYLPQAVMVRVKSIYDRVIRE